MTEAGEAGHWAILGKLNEKAGEKEVGELVEWALPLQEAAPGRRPRRRRCGWPPRRTSDSE